MNDRKNANEKATLIFQFLTFLFAFLAIILPISTVKVSSSTVRKIYLFDSDNAFDLVRDKDWDTDMKIYSAAIYVSLAAAVALSTSSFFHLQLNASGKLPPSTFKSRQVLIPLSLFVSTAAIILLVPELAHSLFVKSETSDGAETQVAAGGYIAMFSTTTAAVSRTLIIIREIKH